MGFLDIVVKGGEEARKKELCLQRSLMKNLLVKKLDINTLGIIFWEE